MKRPAARLKTSRSTNTAEPEKRTRGRPREFDREEALAKAMQLFWIHGYETTSMAELRSAMGITQASLYAAFGSKDQLFREAVELYRRTAGTTTARALEERATARESVEAMLRDAVASFTASGRPPGCLIVLGTINCSQESKPVQDYLHAFRLRTPEAIAERIRRGKREGDVPARAPEDKLAAYYTTVLHGLSIQARDGFSKKSLSSVVDCAMAVWDTMA